MAMMMITTSTEAFHHQAFCCSWKLSRSRRPVSPSFIRLQIKTTDSISVATTTTNLLLLLLIHHQHHHGDDNDGDNAAGQIRTTTDDPDIVSSSMLRMKTSFLPMLHNNKAIADIVSCSIIQILSILSTSLILLLSPLPPVYAVSGGGLDYAGSDISGRGDFANQPTLLRGKDFTQVIAKKTSFQNSNLQGCRFYKAYLVQADFSNADLRGASLEDTSMDDAIMTNAIASGAYFSSSILDASKLDNVDFTDASFPTKTLSQLCRRPDVQGTNPTTNVDTRESLMCPP